MNWRHFVGLFYSIILALVLVVIGIITGSTTLNAYALAILAVGLGVNSLMIALNTDKRVNNMAAALTRIEGLQQEITKAQQEQPSSTKPILATLQGLSQYYLNYIAKQKQEDKMAEGSNSGEKG